MIINWNRSLAKIFRVYITIENLDIGYSPLLWLPFFLDSISTPPTLHCVFCTHAIQWILLLETYILCIQFYHIWGKIIRIITAQRTLLWVFQEDIFIYVKFHLLYLTVWIKHECLSFQVRSHIDCILVNRWQKDFRSNRIMDISLRINNQSVSKNVSINLHWIQNYVWYNLPLIAI